ncbi:hemerythrin domain-containing protein [Pseudalkalibacillus sp. R45]|uniref:hemerythrin domain-containing protein n=1 Tax=Pseudalkalibacillus sp. R45 TaxID=3457433 RepID=UPI003FCED32E
MKSESQFACHQMAAQSTKYCPAIAGLIDEHLKLKLVMEELLLKTKGILDSLEKTEYVEKAALRKEVVRFKKNLELHSYKEEAYLFDTLANYIGRNSGPIAVMEYEHQTAKTYIGQFLSEGCSDKEALDSLKNGIIIERPF